MKRQTPALLIDGNNLMAINTHTHIQLTCPQGNPSGGMFGVLQKIRRMILLDIDADLSDIVFVRDAGRPAFRTEAVPTYKAGRAAARGDDDEFHEKYLYQIARVHKLLLPLGIHVVHADGWEADDTISALAGRTYPYSIIVSGDKDLWQLVRQRKHVSTSVYRPTAEEFITSIPPGYLLKRTLVGDQSDTIPGVKGIGDKRADEIIADLVALGVKLNPDGLLDNYRGKYWDKYFTKEARKAIRRNWEVMNLRKHRDEIVGSMVWKRGAFDEEAFRKQCKRLGFRSILSEWDTWVRVFRDRSEE